MLSHSYSNISNFISISTLVHRLNPSSEFQKYKLSDRKLETHNWKIILMVINFPKCIIIVLSYWARLAGSSFAQSKKHYDFCKCQAHLRADPWFGPSPVGQQALTKGILAPGPSWIALSPSAGLPWVTLLGLNCSVCHGQCGRVGTQAKKEFTVFLPCQSVCMISYTGIPQPSQNI